MKKGLPNPSNLKNLIALLAMMLFVIKVSAQSTLTINGKVVDATTKEGLPGAAVTIKGSSTGTVTDVERRVCIKTGK